MPSLDTLNRGPPGARFPVDTSGLLIETMQLVEPRKSQPVPNHLLETKIYSKIAKNSMVMAKPAVLHFGGYELDEKSTLALSIVNVSAEVLRMHIIPPQTKHFNIKYQKSERLVPGLTLECTVEFHPDEWRYYYDCIRINCPGEDNLIIPIHAYPVMTTKEFPRLFNFPPVPVGHKMTKVFPLKCDAPIDFEYQLTYLQPHQAFSIHPMTGIIPANEETQVEITFAPVEFQTAYMRIQLVISQFNSQPIVCTFTGTSAPGLLKEITQSKYSFFTDEEAVLDPRSLTPVERARSKKKSKPRQPPPTNVLQEVDYQGLKFPAQLDSPYAVSQVLNQEPGRLRAKDLRDVVVTKDSKQGPATRQMKEAKFEHLVRKNVYEERQNQLRWQSKLGDKQMSTETRMKILAKRNENWNEYRFKRRGDPIEEDEYIRTCTDCAFKRTMRDKSQLASEDIQFDTYTNDMWHVRHDALDKFAQAARKVIIRLRASHKLKSLKTLVDDWRQKKFAAESLTEEEKDAEQTEKIEAEEKQALVPHDLELKADKVKLHTFPTYVPPNIKDDMAPDALGSVPFKPMEVVVKRKVPYFGLKVPHQYKLNTYKPYNVQDASSGYVPIKLPKPLRTGAEDEIITLPPPVIVKEKTVVGATRTSLALDFVTEGDLTLADIDDVPKTAKPVQVPSLTPPQALFQPIEYPPLHIFNPAPGLQVFQAPMPYAEVDPEFHLCPVPQYQRKDHSTNVHASTQRKYLDREDTIRGIMQWKKFPSQGLTSLSNTPTLTNVWVPRWNDPFVGELLPEEGPALFDSLSEEDKENIVDEEDEEDGGTTSRVSVSLTPEMVNVQFTMIDQSTPTEEKLPADAFPHGNRMPATNIPVGAFGPVPREKREEELEYFMTKRYNRLGAKIESKVNTLTNLITDPKLVLK